MTQFFTRLGNNFKQDLTVVENICIIFKNLKS